MTQTKNSNKYIKLVCIFKIKLIKNINFKIYIYMLHHIIRNCYIGGIRYLYSEIYFNLFFEEDIK